MDHPRPFNWSINEDGVLCVKNNMKWAGGFCGFVLSDASQTHKRYRNRLGNARVETSDGRAVFMSDWKHFLTFSDFKAGNQG